MTFPRSLALALVAAASLAAHLPRITAPPLDYHHHRQVNTAAIARNYAQDGLRFLEPRIDWEGPYKGRAATEFPLYMWLMGLLWPVAGLGAVWGRVLAALFSAGTACYLYVFLERDLDPRRAFWAAVLFSFIPLEVFFGRTIQPEAIALLGTMGALFHWDRSFTAERRAWDWLAATAWAALAVGSKLPYAFILVPLAFRGWQRVGAAAFRRPSFWAAPVLALGAVWAWYRHASAGVYVVPAHPSEFLSMLRYDELARYVRFQFVSRQPELAIGWAAMPFWLIGVRQAWRESRSFYFFWWGLVAFSLVAAGGYAFHHEYTSLPFAPVNAVFIGLGCAWALDRAGRRARAAALVGLAAIPVFCAGRIHHWYRQKFQYLAGAAAAADSVSKPDDLFVCNERASSVMLFYLGRRGWSWGLPETPHDENARRIEERLAGGAAFFATPKDAGFQGPAASPDAAYVYARYPLVYDREGLLIFALRDGKPGPIERQARDLQGEGAPGLRRPRREKVSKTL